MFPQCFFLYAALEHLVRSASRPLYYCSGSSQNFNGFVLMFLMVTFNLCGNQYQCHLTWFFACVLVALLDGKNVSKPFLPRAHPEGAFPLLQQEHFRMTPSCICAQTSRVSRFPFTNVRMVLKLGPPQSNTWSTTVQQHSFAVWKARCAGLLVQGDWRPSAMGGVGKLWQSRCS